MNASDRVLVLGSGGRVGTAWMAGLLLGLRRAGTDLGRADRIIGTSAGAIVGAALAVGRDLYDSAAWNPAYRAGLEQAAAVDDEIRVQWTKPLPSPNSRCAGPGCPPDLQT